MRAGVQVLQLRVVAWGLASPLQQMRASNQFQGFKVNVPRSSLIEERLA